MNTWCVCITLLCMEKGLQSKHRKSEMITKKTVMPEGKTVLAQSTVSLASSSQ